MRPFDARILRIDLSTESIAWEELDKYKLFIGGRGVNQCILFEEMPIGISPFDPSTMLAIGAGLLCGTAAPGASRISIDTKNVFTGGIGSSSVGGNFGAALKCAGISNLIVTGSSKNLAYLYIDDEQIELRDASHLQHKRVSEVNRILKRELGDDFQIMAIGPAGENLVWPACTIVNNSRTAGRSGTGAVFGAKKLKAIAIRGTSLIEAASPKQFREVINNCVDKLTSNAFNKLRMHYGVYCEREPWGIESPYRNFSGEVPPVEKKERLLRDEFLKYLIEKKDCDDCPLNCWTVHQFKDNSNNLVMAEAFQANSVHNFGAKLDLNDPRDVLEGHALCDDLGLDEDVTCNVIAWAFSCYEEGILTTKDTDDLTLEWGNKDAVFQLIEKIAFREGLGNMLAEGCKRASQKLGAGSDELCMHIKGNDLFECLWMKPAWALGVVVSPRGGTHTRGAVIEERLQDIPTRLIMKLFGIPSIGEVESYLNKEKIVVFMERLNSALDTLGLCMFTHSYQADSLLPEDYADLLSAFSGENTDGDDLLLIGERIHTLEKSYNVLHTDWTRKDDLPPEKFAKVPLAGKYRIDMEKWNELLNRYYDQHGWDRETSWPTGQTLINLGLVNVREKLHKAGKCK